MTRWMKWRVRVKSGTSFERAMRRRMKTTHIRLLSIQTSPSVHPTVVSPLRLRQLSNRSRLTSFPATSAVKMMRIEAQI